MVGERASFSRPFRAALDTITVTRGYIGDLEQSNVLARLHRIARANYVQAQATKRIDHSSLSFDYSSLSGAHVVRGAVVVAVTQSHVVDRVRFEHYGRLAPDRAHGYAITVQRHATPRVMASGGLAVVDRRYGSLNGDVYGVGPRAVGAVSVRLNRGLLASAQIARRLDARTTSSPNTRFDLGLAYDVLAAVANSLP